MVIGEHLSIRDGSRNKGNGNGTGEVVVHRRFMTTGPAHKRRRFQHRGTAAVMGTVGRKGSPEWEVDGDKNGNGDEVFSINKGRVAMHGKTVR